MKNTNSTIDGRNKKSAPTTLDDDIDDHVDLVSLKCSADPFELSTISTIFSLNGRPFSAVDFYLFL